jgi:hypothetical protein
LFSSIFYFDIAFVPEITSPFAHSESMLVPDFSIFTAFYSYSKRKLPGIV